MLDITPAERRALRAKAHALHPVVSVGQQGLTASVLHEIDVALKAHGLIKVRVHSDDRAEREAMLTRIANELDGAAVQHLGKLLVLWRPQEEAEEKTPKPTKRPSKKVTPRKATTRRTREREFQPVARRARSGAAANPRRRRTP